MPFPWILAATLAQQAIGQKQAGAPAPAPVIGGSGRDTFAKMLAQQMNLPETSGLGTMGGVGGAIDMLPDYFRQGSTPPMDTTNDEVPISMGAPLDPVAENLKQSSLADINNGIAEGDVNNPFKQFLGGLDTGLQSPSQVLGLGLLGRLHPNAPLAGLAAMGLLNSGLLKR